MNWSTAGTVRRFRKKKVVSIFYYIKGGKNQINSQCKQYEELWDLIERLDANRACSWHHRLP